MSRTEAPHHSPVCQSVRHQLHAPLGLRFTAKSHPDDPTGPDHLLHVHCHCQVGLPLETLCAKPSSEYALFSRFEVKHVSGLGNRSPPRGGGEGGAANQQILVSSSDDGSEGGSPAHPSESSFMTGKICMAMWYLPNRVSVHQQAGFG